MEPLYSFDQILKRLWLPYKPNSVTWLRRMVWWPDQKFILAYRTSRKDLFFLELQPDGSRSWWKPTQADILADDWQEYRPPSDADAELPVD